MPSLIFLIPVLSSTMVPVARTVVVILETFLLEERDLFVLEEKTLLLLARDADKDMDKTEEAILIYQFYLRCCVLCVITMRKFFCARSKKKKLKLTSLSASEREKKGENSRDSLLFWPKRRSFFPQQEKKRTKGRGENRGGKKSKYYF